MRLHFPPPVFRFSAVRQRLLLCCALACLLFVGRVALVQAADPSGSGVSPVLVVTGDLQPLTGALEYAVDAQEQVGLTEILGAADRLNFQPLLHQSTPAPGVPIWYRIRLRDDLGRDLVLNFEEMLFDRIWFVYETSTGVHSHVTGMDYPYHSRPRDYRYFSFPFKLDAGQETVLYFRTYTSHLPLIAPTIGSVPAIGKMGEIGSSISLLTIGICAGVLLFMIVFSPLAAERLSMYLFCVYLMNVTLIVAQLSGYLYPLMPDSPELHKALMVYLLCVNNIVNLVLFRVYLDVERRDALSWWVIHGTSGMFVLLMVLYPWLGYRHLMLPTIAVVSLNYFVLFAISLRYFLRGARNSGLFLLAGTVFFLCTGYAILGAQGLVPYNLVVRHMFVGLPAVIQTLFYAVAITRRVYWQLRERDELEKKAAIAESESRTKSEFLATMSHEIRTPVNGVLGMTQMLQSTALTAEQRQYTDIIHSSSRILLAVINDILDYSKIEAGKMELECTELDLDELIWQTGSVFFPTASRTGIHFSATFDPECPVRLMGDPVRLQQVLNNLLSNAFKFTEQGLVSLSVSCASRQQNSVELMFTVKDTGIGIPPEKIGLLFESFSQADRSTTRKYGGTGLGLSISKKLVQLMGGEIGVRSVPGQGSEFWFTARFGIDTPRQRGWVAACEPLRGHSVLVIFPYGPILEYVTRHLSGWGMDIHTAKDLRSALTLSQPAQRFEAIYITTLSLERATPEERAAFFALPGQVIFSEHFGFLGELVLPADWQPVVRLRIPHGLTQLRDALLQAVAVNAGERRSPQRARYQGLDKLKVLVAEDNPVNRKVVEAMLRQQGVATEFAEDGHAVIQIYEERKGQFSLVLMDCEMPGLDGFGASERIRRYEQQQNLPSTPIIALTAHVLPEAKARCLNSGMNAVLHKPLDRKQLLDAVQQFAGLKAPL